MGRSLGSSATIHEVVSLADPKGPVRFAELHALPATVDHGDLLAEIAALAEVRHTSLLAVIDAGVLGPNGLPWGDGDLEGNPNGTLYVITEPWDRTLSPEGLDEAALRGIGADIASALAAIHRAGRLHGALHRGAVRKDGDRCKLSSAGMIAVLEAPVAPYRPPGLHVMEPPSAQADLWNLGILLHELGTGRLLRPGEDPSVAGAPVVDEVVAKLLQPDPQARISADEVVDRLLDPLTSSASRTAPPAGVLPAGDTHRMAQTPISSPSGDGRGRWTWLAAGAAAVIIAASVVGGFALAGRGASGEDLEAEAAVNEVTASAEAKAGLDEQSTEDTATDDTATGDTAAGDTATEDGPVEGQQTSGLVALADVQAGDCLDLDLSQGVLTEADRRPCDAPHVAEVVAVATPPAAGETADYPGRVALAEFGIAACRSEFELYVGQPEITSTISSRPILPTFNEWERGDRQTIVCLASTYGGDPIDRSVANSFPRFTIRDGVTVSIGKLLRSACFEFDGDFIVKLGKRQEVTVIGCPGPHRYEVFDVDLLSLESDEAGAASPPDLARWGEIALDAEQRCAARWEEMAKPPGIGEGEPFHVVPDTYDWLQGDRFFLCAVQWQDEVLGSVALHDYSINGPRDESADEGGAAEGGAADGEGDT